MGKAGVQAVERAAEDVAWAIDAAGRGLDHEAYARLLDRLAADLDARRRMWAGTKTVASGQGPVASEGG